MAATTRFPWVMRYYPLFFDLVYRASLQFILFWLRLVFRGLVLFTHAVTLEYRDEKSSLIARAVGSRRALRSLRERDNASLVRNQER